jgi:hypothetical protein
MEIKNNPQTYIIAGILISLLGFKTDYFNFIPAMYKSLLGLFFLGYGLFLYYKQKK